MTSTRHWEDTAGDGTSSISLVFDFSSESTLEWRLLTVLLKLAKKRHIQSPTGSKAGTAPLPRLMFTDVYG